MSKKEYERRKREIAGREAKALVESKDRQERINVLWNLDKQQFKGAKNPTEGEHKLKAEKLKKLIEAFRELTSNDDLLELVELAYLQDGEIEYLTRFRRDWERIKTHHPEELKNLSFASSIAELKPHIEKMLAKRKPKETYEQKRRKNRWGQIGEIEREFGGVESSVPTFSELVNPGLSAYRRKLGISSLLDDIFAGGGVSMLRLQDLFGLNRNRFPKNLPSFKMGRERLYDYRAVTDIIDAFLSEKPLKRSASRRGRPASQWLRDSSLRAHVLAGIEARMNTLSVSDDILAAFVSVIRRHLPDSAKK